MTKGKSRFAGLETSDRARPATAAGAAARDAEYYLRIALERELNGEHDAALNAYASALGEDPLCIEAWARQLWMLLYLEELKEATVWSDKALQSFPNDPDILSLKSLAQWRSGLPEAARALNDRALEATRDSANVWLARGEMQLDADMKSALTCFKHAEAAPGPKGLTSLRAGDILLRRRKFAEASGYYRDATQALPESSWAWYGYGRAQRALGREQYAVAAFSRAFNIAPRDSRYRDAKKMRLGWLDRLRRWAGLKPR